MNDISRNGTQGRVYGGDACLIHCEDGTRAEVGAFIADKVNEVMREDAFQDGRRTAEEAATQKLCPGCYMIVGLDALVVLARENGQPLTELAASMAEAFAHIRDTMGPMDYDLALTEEINVILDKE